MGRPVVRHLLAAILVVVVLVVVGFVAGYAAASAESDPPHPTVDRSIETTTTSLQSPGSIPDYLSAAASVNDIVALLASWQEARDAAAAPLVALGWTPDVCEPEVEGVPKATDRPTCEPIIPSVGHWLAINRCEQGGDWHAYGRFGNGLMGGGGLGISDGAWREWGGGQFASNAAGASPYAQMIVASRGYARYGGSPWGCKA